MENASKALIIAGAVLLSILIIAIGMAIYNGAQENVQGAMTGMDETAIAAHNAKFEAYQGTKKGSEVKTMLSSVIAYNQANSQDLSRRVQVTSRVAVQAAAGANVGYTPSITIGGNAGEGMAIAAGGGVTSWPSYRLNSATAVTSTSDVLTALRSQVQTGRSYRVDLIYGSTALVICINIILIR